MVHRHFFNPLSAKLTKWPNTLKQFVGNLPTNCLSVFGHFVGLAFKGLTNVTKNPILDGAGVLQTHLGGAHKAYRTICHFALVQLLTMLLWLNVDLK